jgi:hypothetical protein
VIKETLQTALGQQVLFLGLSGENVTRLVAGEPIRIGAHEVAGLGLPAVEVVIRYGRTEQDILDEVQAHGLPVREQPAHSCEHQTSNFTPCGVCGV